MNTMIFTCTKRFALAAAMCLPLSCATIGNTFETEVTVRTAEASTVTINEMSKQIRKEGLFLMPRSPDPLTVTIASEHVDTTLLINARMSDAFYWNFALYGMPIGMLIDMATVKPVHLSDDLCLR
ncbi:MAG: hypothetical protein LBF19_00365 [Prevotellaceae bacterium]|jgi:hypothetical protein|nr:hypothetical protein [Prevotellaceae bacterium]